MRDRRQVRTQEVQPVVRASASCIAAAAAAAGVLAHGRHQQHVRATAGRARSTPPTSSSSTDGANGRNPSRNLTFRFSRFCISGLRGSPRMLRLPSARGPNSMRPWNQPPTLPCGQPRRDVAASAVGDPRSGERGAVATRCVRSICFGGELRAEIASRAIASQPTWSRSRGFVAAWICQTAYAAPTAPPASPAAG